MATELYPETAVQFLARMLVATREGHQIHSRDARRLSDLAVYGRDQQRSPTMPEERRDASRPLTSMNESELVTG